MTKNSNLYERYRNLAEQYMQGRTSVAEENELAGLLRTMDESRLTAQDRVLRMLLTEAADNREKATMVSQKNGEPVTTEQQPPRNRRPHRYFLMTLTSMAAAVALLLVLKTGLNESGNNSELPTMGLTAGKPLESEEEALRLAEKALNDVAYDPMQDLENIQW